MKNENKIKSGKTKTRKKSGNSKLIIAAVLTILLVGMAYALTVPTKVSQKTTPISLKEVRAQIDLEYGKKGTGTDTPAVIDNYIPILSPRKVDKLPDFAYTNAMTLKAYQFATEHPEILEQIPCYCGCGEHGSEMSEGKPHKFVRDCFITDKGVYDSHASFCDICVAINVKAQSALPSGGL
jgi:hypothetical protein